MARPVKDHAPRPETRRYLVIDQGGHATRALVVDGAGELVGAAEVEIPTRRPGPGRVEHDPETLVRSVRTAVDLAVARLAPAADLTAAGFATQRSSVVCWDRRSGAALSPVISWQDRRGAAQVAGMGAHAAEVHARTGLVLSAHAGASKLRWCLDALPAVARARHEGRLAWGPLASFLLFRLLEERPCVIDPANAARTQLVDLDRGAWSPALLEWFGLPAGPLPRLVPTIAALGHLSAGGARVPVTACSGDQPAALLAGGEPAPETVAINLGTGAFVQRVLADGRLRAPGLLTGAVCSGGGPRLWALEATINGAGSALAEVGGELFPGAGDLSRRAAEWLEEIDDPPLFLNGVSGLGAPYWIPHFPSRFVGTGPARARIVAVLESVVFLIRVNLDAMAACLPRPEGILVTGGLGALDGLCRRLAALCGTPVQRPALREATARGAAYLAAGRPPGWPPPEVEKRFEPEEDRALFRRFDRWRGLMEASVRSESTGAGRAW